MRLCKTKQCEEINKEIKCWRGVYFDSCFQVKDNVCYNTLGHAYFIEDGGEKDTTFDGNLAASVKTGELIPSDKFVFAYIFKETG